MLYTHRANLFSRITAPSCFIVNCTHCYSARYPITSAAGAKHGRIKMCRRLLRGSVCRCDTSPVALKDVTGGTKMRLRTAINATRHSHAKMSSRTASNVIRTVNGELARDGQLSGAAPRCQQTETSVDQSYANLKIERAIDPSERRQHKRARWMSLPGGTRSVCRAAYCIDVSLRAKIQDRFVPVGKRTSTVLRPKQ